MSNYHLRDKNLSYKAKGLLSFMLSLPDDWKYFIEGLKIVSKESTKAISNTLNELEQNKYLKRCKFKNEKGHFYYDYIIYEVPFCDNEIDIKKINTKTVAIKEENHSKLTLELIKNNFISIDDIEIYYYDNLFDELLKDYDYIQLIIVTRYILKCLEKRNYKSEIGDVILNRFGYFKESIYNNLKLLNENIDELYD